MPQRINRDPSAEIEVLVPIRVPNIGALAMVEHELWAVVDGQYMCLEAFNGLLRLCTYGRGGAPAVGVLGLEVCGAWLVLGEFSFRIVFG
jgi:hypothetical protein